MEKFSIKKKSNYNEVNWLLSLANLRRSYYAFAASMLLWRREDISQMLHKCMKEPLDLPITLGCGVHSPVATCVEGSQRLAKHCDGEVAFVDGSKCWWSLEGLDHSTLKTALNVTLTACAPLNVPPSCRKNPPENPQGVH